MAQDNPHVEAKVPAAPPVTNSPPKRYVTAVAFSLFCGALGIDRFYLGYTGLGILKLVTFGGFGIWALVDLILVLTGKLGSADGQPLVIEDGDKKFMKLAAIVYIVGWLLTLALFTIFAVVMIAAVRERPDLFIEDASTNGQLLSADDVYGLLDVGMAQESARNIFEDNGYTSDCAKHTTTEGTSEECIYWRFSWDNDDQIAVSYQDGKVAEIAQQSTSSNTPATSEEY